MDARSDLQSNFNWGDSDRDELPSGVILAKIQAKTLRADLALRQAAFGLGENFRDEHGLRLLVVGINGHGQVAEMNEDGVVLGAK